MAIYKRVERKQLVQLCKRAVEERARGQITKETSDKITAIGQKLGDEGDMELMLSVGESLENPKWRSIVEYEWNGIHGWYA